MGAGVAPAHQAAVQERPAAPLGKRSGQKRRLVIAPGPLPFPVQRYGGDGRGRPGEGRQVRGQQFAQGFGQHPSAAVFEFVHRLLDDPLEVKGGLQAHERPVPGTTGTAQAGDRKRPAAAFTGGAFPSHPVQARGTDPRPHLPTAYATRRKEEIEQALSQPYPEWCSGFHVLGIGNQGLGIRHVAPG
ncbi:MAG: hypothetical protein QXU79_02800 [Candidatus Micrarchaeaceae archaeon]